MLEQAKTQALIIQVRPQKETGALVTAYTRVLGLTVLIAAGLKKPLSKLAPVLLAGNIVFLTIIKKTHWRVTGAKLVSSSTLSLAEPIIFRFSSLALEVLNNLIPPEQPNEDLYNGAIKILSVLTSKIYPIELKEAAVYSFIFDIFASQGILPDWQTCQYNGSKIKATTPIFWHTEKGVVSLVNSRNYNNQFLTKISTSLKKILQSPNRVEQAIHLSPSDLKLWQNIVKDIYQSELNKPLLALTD